MCSSDLFAEAVRVQQRLFTTKPIFLGVEAALRNPEAPCGLKTDSERARHMRRRVREIHNSRGEWEPMPPCRETPLSQVRVPVEDPAPGPDNEPSGPPRLVPALTVPAALENVGVGGVAKVADSPEGPLLGRSMIVEIGRAHV